MRELEEIYKTFDVTIGLEIHCQLKTQSKLFATSHYHYGEAPNSCLDPITAALPGALPQINRLCVELAVRMGLSLSSQIQKRSRFVRKSYFYPDLPKGFQISQLQEPICLGGFLTLKSGKTVRIQQIQLEEDAGKSTHLEHQALLDLNRAGVGLIEIVSAPDMETPEEVREFLKMIHQIATELDVTEGSLEKGHLRADANISLRPKGSQTLGERVEIKNLNSFKFVEKAIISEILRQASLVQKGLKVERETRGYNPQTQETFVMRTKENLQDYRYMPEPDLPILVLSDQDLEEFRSRLKPTFWEREQSLKERCPELPQYDLEVISHWAPGYEYFLKLLDAFPDPERHKTLSNLYMSVILGLHKVEIEKKQLDERHVSNVLFPLDWACQGFQALWEGKISERQLKEIFELSLTDGLSPVEIMNTKQIQQISDEETIRQILKSVFQNHPKELEAYRSGRTKLKGFFLGQAMKKTGGSLNPQKAAQILDDLLREQE